MARSRGLAGTAAVLLLTGTLGGGKAEAQVLPGIDLERAIANTRVGAAPDTFGSSTTILTLHYSAFEVRLPEQVAHLNWADFRRVCPTGTCVIEAPVILPNGALVDSIEVEGCDDSPSFNMFGSLLHLTLNENSGVVPTGAAVATSGTPGCTTFSSNLTPPHQIVNATRVYQFIVAMGNDAFTAFRAARIRYRLQVSSAPAISTFPVDVPTSHPFFRFVEALAAAGVTAGCGAGTYCPDAPITRGQMAVFLAVALGLHFPN